MKNKSAFTLVEIMIVIAIIALLAAMAIPAFQKVKADNAKRNAPASGPSAGRFTYERLEYVREVATYPIICTDTKTGRQFLMVQGVGITDLDAPQTVALEAVSPRSIRR